MLPRLVRRLVLVALAVAAVLHQDYWNWYELSWVGGLPSGFAYHLGFCFAVAVLLGLLVRSDASDDEAESQ